MTTIIKTDQTTQTMTCFDDIYRGRRVLVSGQTGFKGSWLWEWLRRMGAQIGGIALAPLSEPNHWNLLYPEDNMSPVDVRDAQAVQDVVQEFEPEIVFHLAAEALVRRSYHEPLQTMSTNILGTQHVYEACRKVQSVRAIVSITSDKVYQNQEREAGYLEHDRLGGADPYSCSKACVELLSDCYRQSFFQLEDSPLLATVRAGNVIGGGDWAEDRIVVDAVRAASRGEVLRIRNPHAVRPWQHVLEPLAGYLMVGQALLTGNRNAATAWNFGPRQEDAVPVGDLVVAMTEVWPKVIAEFAPEANAPHETKILRLNSNCARDTLGWQPLWSWREAVDRTLSWYRQYYEEGACCTAVDFDAYIQRATERQVQWVQPQ